MNRAAKRRRGKTEPNPATAQALELALRHHGGGDLAQAESIYRQVLQGDGKNPFANHLLGVVHHQQGDNERARKRIAKALRAAPGYADAHANMGLVLQALGRFRDALASYQKVLALRPGTAGDYINLGNVHRDLERPEDALTAYRRALSLDPGAPDTLNNLGLLYGETGQPEDAVACFRQALEARPGFVDVLLNLGNVLMEGESGEEALSRYREALRIEPDSPAAHFNLANALKELERMDDAIGHYRQAVTLSPGFAGAHNNLGLALQEAGKIEQAMDSFRNAIAADPDHAPAHRHLAHIKKHRSHDADIRAMEDALARPGIGGEQKMHLSFGLGKAFEDLRDYDKAFHFFRQGNDLKWRDGGRFMERQTALFDSLMDLFQPSFFEARRDFGCPDETPIFLLGLPRSGSTLLEQILASQPRVAGTGEKPTLSRAIEEVFGDPLEPGFTDTINGADAEDFRRAGLAYAKALRAPGLDAPIIADKMLDNFVHVGLIKLMLPKAKVVHCRRRAEDHCLSIYKCHFAGDSYPYSYSLQALADYHGLYRELMAHWERALPGFMFDAGYEDLIADQEGKTRDLLAFCGLPWDDRCLDFHNTERTVKTASVEQVRKPLYDSSVAAWKRYEQHLAPLLGRLGK